MGENLLKVPAEGIRSYDGVEYYSTKRVTKVGMSIHPEENSCSFLCPASLRAVRAVQHVLRSGVVFSMLPLPSVERGDQNLLGGIPRSLAAALVLVQASAPAHC
jgi:hypothetical protein